jgi:hypothetical protein
MFLAIVLKRNRTHIGGSTAIHVTTASTLSASAASSASVLATGTVAHFHNKRTICWTKYFPFLGCKVSHRVANINPINHNSVATCSASGAASMTSASAAVPGPATSSSTASMSRVDCVNSAFLASLLLIFELSRAVDPGNLLRKITARPDKVSWVLLINNNFCGQKLAFLAFNGFK